MTPDPQGFLKHQRREPAMRPPVDRLRDFRDLYDVPPGGTPFPLAEQASRCMGCGVPFCHGEHGCPLGNLVPDWNDLVRRGKWREALTLLHATNNFPELTGKLCPAPCESACVLGLVDEPVAIRTIESAIADRGFFEGWIEPVRAKVQRRERVAVIGSGPAGLAAAQELARKGFRVTVFEKAEKPGGLLRFGIPDFKLEKWVLDRRLAQLEAEGVVFKTGVHAGVDVPAERLRLDFDALCLTIGAEAARDLSVPGRELGGVVMAMDYLAAQNREAPDRATARGKKVVVLGGGDTGSDCAGTALRQGAKEVLQLELHPRPPETRAKGTPWPLWPMQLRSSHAHTEGGMRQWNTVTKAFVGDARGSVRALHCASLEWRSGAFHEVPGSDFELPAELVVLAMGFSGTKPEPLLDGLGIERDAAGRIVTKSTYKTSADWVYAAGDARRGASLIVWAIAEGRKMAAAVAAAL